MLLREKELSNSQFVLYIFLFTTLVDWDLKHKHTYATCGFSNREIAYGLGWESSTVSKNINSLKEKGLLVKNSIDLYELSGYKALRYLMKCKSAGVFDIKKIISSLEPKTSMDVSLDIDEIYQGMELNKFREDVALTSK